MELSRRIFCAALPALAAASALGEETSLLPSKIYDLNTLPARQIKAALSRGMFTGKLYEGCEISLHETDLAPMSAPHAPHTHRHEEMILIIEGTLEFTIKGEPTRAGAGSILFAGSNEEHGIRNPTAEHAKYFVLALGPANN
jgi:mannose-6-phosphate isomerase-like protein (cupin superfamily)